MRRRERFIVFAIALGVLLWLIQLVPIGWRYVAIVGFAVITYFASALVMRDKLKARFWLTFLPLPALYSLTIGNFYFLLPSNFWSMIVILGLFALGMYALFLSGNIFAKSQDRSIQLLQAAQNVCLFFAVLISLLGVQVIFSFNQVFYLNFIMIFLLHFPLAYSIIWSVNLDETLSLKNFQLTFFSSLLISEIALGLSFLPLASWHIALLIMSVFYLILGILQVYLSAKFFRKESAEYLLLAVFVVVMFIIFFPGK
jgi:hypothetical protein